MSAPPNDNQLRQLMESYGGRSHGSELIYWTVRDYCDSYDCLPFLASAQGDLKDLQRPWMVKALLSRVPRESKLLEVGGGEPLVAALLAQLGFDVTVIDPYDGSGFGPTNFANFVQ